MASKIKVDQIEGAGGSTITIPTGQTFTITDGITGTGANLTALNATEITSGTIPSADRLPTVTVAKGGTNLTSFTAGDVLYATGSTTLAKLAKGSASQVLSMNSGATAPEWADAAGGATAVVASGSISGSPSEIICDGIFTSAYRFYELFIADLHANGNTSIHLQMRNSDATVSSSNYRSLSHNPHMSSSSANGDGLHTGWDDAHWEISGNAAVYSHVVSAMGGRIFFPYGDNISTYNQIHWKTWAQETSTTSQYNIMDGAGIYNGYQQYDGFRLFPSSGTFEEGEYTVIGYKQ